MRTELHAGGQTDRRTERQGKILVALRNTGNPRKKASFVLGIGGLGNIFVDGGGVRNVNGDTNLLSTNDCAIDSLP